ncbi:hypothetical protein BS78_03G200900 [Paspalum vaginatum]|nr:hypothetical protein BS78_03G200900 [Paspalum vaginatum]
MAEHFVNDWDLQAVVRSCGGALQHAEPEPEPAAAAPPTVSKASAAALPYDLEYLDLDHKPFLLPAAPGDDGREREVMISFPAAAASTSSSGAQQRAEPTCRKPGARTPRPKRSKKSQLKKVVREMPVAEGGASSSSDPWAWRKYGQKPIKGSPYPRGYYKCSSMKGCMARKLVERSPAKPGVLVVTYMAEHCHPVPTQLNALAGTTRHKPSHAAASSSSSPKGHHQQERGTAAAGGGEGVAAAESGADAGDDDGEFWPAGMGGMDLDDLLAPADDDLDLDLDHVTEDGVLERRLSL